MINLVAYKSREHILQNEPKFVKIHPLEVSENAREFRLLAPIYFLSKYQQSSVHTKQIVTATELFLAKSTCNCTALFTYVQPKVICTFYNNLGSVSFQTLDIVACTSWCIHCWLIYCPEARLTQQHQIESYIFPCNLWISLEWLEK